MAADELFSQVPQTLLKPERQTILGDSIPVWAGLYCCLLLL